jgi:NADH-quinone oxidoreductase subunit G
MASATGLGVVDGDAVTVTGPVGSVTLPAVVTDGMVDGVVWLPTNARSFHGDCSIRTGLGTDAGGRVHVTKGGAA